MTDQRPTPVTEDADATVDELLARAHQELDRAVTARLDREAVGGQRQGILPSGGH